MPQTPTRKLDLVRRLVTLLPDPHTETIDMAMKTWWVNLRSNGGLRLTEYGYHVFKNLLELDYWQVEFNRKDPVTKQMILDLDRKLDWPYYIDTRKRKLIFFSSKEAMMATLYGDLTKWLTTLQQG